MKKGLVFLLAASTLFGLGFMGQTEKVEAAETWNLVKDVNSLEAGDQIIIAAKDYNYALSTTQNGNNRGQAAITRLEETVSFGSSVQILTLNTGKNDNTFGLYTGSGYLYAASSGSNYLRTESTLSANSSWSFSIAADGTATVKATGSNTRNVLQYNQSSSIFSCYGSASQKPIVIYELNDGTGGDVEKTPTEEVNELLTSYYNNGSYQRDTVINLNEAAQLELISCFHANVNILDRTTYFVGNQLWMSHGAKGDGKYSYYGTRGEDMTSGHSSEAFVQPKSIHIAQKGVTMEGKYTTMNDIKDNAAEWTKNGEVYSTNDLAVIQMFLDFTAPCFLGISDDNDHYFSLDHVEVEQKGETLELRLVTTGDQGKLETNANGVLSVAIITKRDGDKVTYTQYVDAPVNENVVLEGVVVANCLSDAADKKGFILDDEKGNNKIFVYSTSTDVKVGDKVSVEGTLVNEPKRFKANAVVKVIEASDYESKTKEVTVEDAVAVKLEKTYISNDKYVVEGNIEVSSGVYYVTDGTNKIQLLAGSLTDLHDGCEVKVTGKLANHNGNIVFVNYEFEITAKMVYSVTVNCGANGSYEISSPTAEYNSDVTITVTPNDGFVIDSVKANGGAIPADSENTYIYNVKANTTIEILFVEESEGGQVSEPVTVSKSMEDLITEYGWTSSTVKQSFDLDSIVSVKVDGGANTGKAYDGDHIRIYATDKPAGTLTISVLEGYELQSVKISTKTGSTYAYLYVDGTTIDICNKETNVSGTSVLLNSVQNGSNGKQVRITAIEVTYIKA